MKFSHLSRLYTTKSLAENQTILIDGSDFHYLKTVMRLRLGESVRLFNSIDGEYLATVAAVNRASLEVKIEEVLRIVEKENSLILALSIIKPDRMIEAVKAAAAIGATQIIPIISERTQQKKIARDRIERCVLQAIEQSERFVPTKILEETTLLDFLNQYQVMQIIAACESESCDKKISNISKIEREVAVLIGPEGGFSDAEMIAIKQNKNVHSVSLGRSVLRSEIAAISALSCIQMLKE